MSKQDQRELQRLLLQCGQDHEDDEFYCAGCNKLQTRCECAELAFAKIQGLLFDLDLAEEECARLRGLVNLTSGSVKPVVTWVVCERCKEAQP